MTRSASERKDVSPPIARLIPRSVLRRIPPIAMAQGSDGFIPVMLAASVIASAILLALD
jgi:hypothetical protein